MACWQCVVGVVKCMSADLIYDLTSLWKDARCDTRLRKSSQEKLQHGTKGALIFDDLIAALPDSKTANGRPGTTKSFASPTAGTSTGSLRSISQAREARGRGPKASGSTLAVSLSALRSLRSKLTIEISMKWDQVGGMEIYLK